MDSESEAERKTNSDEYTSSRSGRKCRKNGERKVLEYRGVTEIRFEHRQGGKQQKKRKMSGSGVNVNSKKHVKIAKEKIALYKWWYEGIL